MYCLTLYIFYVYYKWAIFNGYVGLPEGTSKSRSHHGTMDLPHPENPSATEGCFVVAT
jgi:hypothetical protein